MPGFCSAGKARVALYVKEDFGVFSGSTCPGGSEPRHPLLHPTLNRTMESEENPYICFVLFLFHEGQARLQLLVPLLPALGCAAISLLEMVKSFLVRLAWNISGLRDTSSRTQGHRDRLETCAAAPSTWLCFGLSSRNGNTQEKIQVPPSRATRVVMAPDCSFPEREISRKATRSKCNFSGHLFLTPVLNVKLLKTS